MRESRLSESVEGVMGNHDSYSDFKIQQNHPETTFGLLVSYILRGAYFNKSSLMP